MANAISAQTTRVHKLGNHETSSTNAATPSYNMSTGFGSSKQTWAGNIWGNRGFKNGFADGTGDVSQFKGSQFKVDGDFEGKTGSSSLLASSESEGWGRGSGVPWNTSNGTNAMSVNANKSISPVRHRHGEQSSSGQATSGTGRSSSPYFTLGADVETRDNSNGYQSSLSPPLVNGSGQKLPESSPFASFPNPRQVDNTNSNYSTASNTQHMPSLSRSISHGDAYVAQNGYSSMNDNTMSRTITSTSIPSTRAQTSRDASQSGHNGQTSVSAQRPTHSSHPSFHSLAFDSLDRSGGDDIEFVPSFGNLSLQNGAYNHLQATNYPGNGSSYQQRESNAGGQKYQFGQASNQAMLTPQSLDETQDQAYQLSSQGYFKNNAPAMNGFLTPNPSSYRRGVSNQTYSSAGTPPTMPDMLNPSNSAITARGSNASAALLERKLRGLQPLQQEPASYVPGQFAQHNGLQPRMQFPNPYDFAAYSSVRMNPLANPYTMPSYLGYMPQPQLATRGYSPRDNDPIRSPLLEEFRTNSRTNKRFELKDIYNHVVEFAGDQHGSRFIQQKLETANSDEKDQVFKEIQPNSLQLMTDLFGNYVIQKLFEHGNQAQKKILANQMKGHVQSLSKQMYGCRVVQKALEHILTDQQATLINELNTRALVLECVRDQNGNHVIQKAIERVPPEHIQFIIDAFLGQIAHLSAHAYGCRVIQRMLEHCKDPARRQILDELHACIPTLITDQFGNYVIQHVIEHGDDSDKFRIVSIISGNVINYSKHKFASNVVEKCIEHGAPQQRAEVLRLLTTTNEEGENPVLTLVRDQYGNYVIQKVLKVLKGQDRENVINQIRPHLAGVKKVSCGKQIVAIEKMILDADFESTQSSQSSSLPSTNASTADGPVTPGASIGMASPPASVNGSLGESAVKTPTGAPIGRVAEVGC